MLYWGEAFVGGVKRFTAFSAIMPESTQVKFLMQTYLFYDLETSGLSPCFDQVYQFAGIRTDLEFNEIERYDFLVKPTIDIIPSPEAMITHRLGINLLQEKGQQENEVVFKIHQLLNAPGTISLGYNTLTFDDEFLRFNFYRHLLTPYTHQYASQCRRMDLFPMTVFYWLFRQDHIKWGMREDRVSLKLEDLSLENQLAIGQAHNAIVDVEATINLARKLKEDPKMWAYLADYFIKSKDAERLQALPLVAIGDVQYSTGLAIEGKFGFKQSFQVPVVGLGQHRHYANQTIWLKLDDERILSGDSAFIPEIWTLKKRLGEPPFILEAKDRFNRLDDERKKLTAETLQFLQQTPKFFKAIQDYALDFKFPVYKETDIDAALYQNAFWSNEDVMAMRRFWNISTTEKRQLQFRREELNLLASRFLSRFYGSKTAEFAHDLKQIWMNEESGIVDYRLQPKLSCNAALKRLQAIDLAPLDAEQKLILQGVEHYLKQMRQTC